MQGGIAVQASRSGHSIAYKAIATCVAVAFILNSVFIMAWAEDSSGTLFTGSGRGGGSHPGHDILNPGNIAMPLSMGYIRETYISGIDKPMVIYIQDAHCNYSCQRNIEAIIGYFNKNYGVDTAAVEGGAGKYDFSIFTSIPDIDIREAVADYFVREGRVTGVELFAIKNPEKITVRGLEDPGLYESNLSVYRESLQYKELVDKYLSILRHFIENLKPPIFSGDLKKFDEEKTAYNENKNKLKDYILYLYTISCDNNIKIDMFNNLMRLIKLMDEEKEINFEQAQKEREAAIDVLMKKLSKVEIATLVKNSIDFKKEDMSPASFYEYLFTKIEATGIGLKEYSNLVKYKAYLDKYDNLEKDVFFEEMFDVEKHFAENIIKTQDERDLFYLSDDLDILSKLFSVSLTRQQYDYFSKNKSDLRTQRYVDFITQKAPWYNQQASVNPEVKNLDIYKDKISQFYEYSFKRDEVFMRNLAKYSSGTDAIFMVTGGFHTDNMKELMKKEGYSYVLITPKIAQEKYNPYFKLLGGGLSPIETILSEYISVIAIRSAFSEMGIKSDWVYLRDATYAMVKLLNEVKKNGIQKSELILVVPEGDFHLKLTFKKPAQGDFKSVGKIAGEELFVVPIMAEEIDGTKGAADVFYLRTSDIEAFEKEMREEMARPVTASPIKVERKRIVVRPDKATDWESFATYNPGVAEIDGVRYIFYRAHNAKDKISRIGIKILYPDGREVDYHEPFITPHENFEKFGIEDIRVTRIEDNAGVEQLAFVGTAHHEGEPDAQIEMSYIPVEMFKQNMDAQVPFSSWEGWSSRRLVFPTDYGKDAVLFPEKVPGPDGTMKYAMLFRGPDYDNSKDKIRIAVADSLDGRWEPWDGNLENGIVMQSSEKWESYAIGAGIPPIKTPYGWLVIYHGVEWVGEGKERVRVYRAGLALLDLENPSKLIYKSTVPFMQPETNDETKGFMSNVVFPTGAVITRNDEKMIEMDMYYGAADNLTGEAYVAIDLERLADLAGIEKDEKAEPEIPKATTVDEYIALQAQARADASSAIQKGFKVPIILEANERMLYSESNALDNIVQQFKNEAKAQITSLVGPDGEVDLIVTSNREETVTKIEDYLKEKIQPVVFRLSDFGGMTEEFKELLQNNRVPCLSLVLQPPDPKVPDSDKAIVDPFSLAQMAVLADGLNKEIMLGDKADQVRVKVLKDDMMKLKAHLEMDRIKPFPEEPLALYDGASLNIILPRITQLNINEMDKWHRALRKLESAL